MASSSKSVRKPDFNQELKKREGSFDRKIRNHICQFLKNAHLDILIVEGPLVRIVNALTRLNEDIDDHTDIEDFLSYENQTRFFADQTTNLLNEKLNNLIVCEVPAVVEEDSKIKLIKIIKKNLETNHRQKAIFVKSKKTTLEKYLKNLGKVAIMQIKEMERDILLTYPDPNVDLYQASSAGDINRVRKLLANGIKVNNRVYDANNRTALHAAVENGHKNVVLQLLAYGADVLIQDNDQQQPIDLAIKNNNDDIILRDIFKINEKLQNDGETRLHLAAGSGLTQTVKLLITFGADINILNSNNFTPLCLAICRGYEETAKILTDLGADLNILCNGKTALDWAKVNCSSRFVKYLKWKGAKTLHQLKIAKLNNIIV